MQDKQNTYTARDIVNIALKLAPNNQNKWVWATGFLASILAGMIRGVPRFRYIMDEYAKKQSRP